MLTEPQRNCRLPEENHNLKIFNVYTQEACLMECKIGKAYKRCGCLPWHFPVNIFVRYILLEMIIKDKPLDALS